MAEKEKKRKVKREVIEWVAIVVVFGSLYLSGWHTEVIGQFQRIIVATGIMQPSEIDISSQQSADYKFTLSDLNGNQVNFEEFKGKTVFLNFWATWCPPCIAEMPDIHALYQDMKDNENVVFAMVSLDQDVEKARSFIERKEFEFPVYQLASRRPAVFQSQSIPTTFIISPEGKILAKHSGMAKYNTEKVRSLLTSE